MNSDDVKKVCAEMREKWLRIGLSCEPCDFEAARDAAARAYIQAGLKPPKTFLLADSPISCAMMADELRSGDQVRTKVVDHEDRVRDKVWVKARPTVWYRVQDQVRDRVWRQVWHQVLDLVWDQVRHQVWDQIWDQAYGSHDAPWLGFYDCMGALGYQDIVEPLRPLMDLAEVCGWWAPYEDVCILQHRHSELHFDDEGRLHRENGPAILYRDGFAVYARHGDRDATESLVGTKMI